MIERRSAPRSASAYVRRASHRLSGASFEAPPWGAQIGLFLRRPLPEALELDVDDAVFDPARERVQAARRGPGQARAVGGERRVVARAVEPAARRRLGRPRSRGAGRRRSRRRRRVPLRSSHAAPSSTSFSSVQASRWSATSATRFGSPSGSDVEGDGLDPPPRARAAERRRDEETHRGHGQRGAPDGPAHDGERLQRAASIGLCVVGHARSLLREKRSGNVFARKGRGRRARRKRTPRDWSRLGDLMSGGATRRCASSSERAATRTRSGRGPSIRRIWPPGASSRFYAERVHDGRDQQHLLPDADGQARRGLGERGPRGLHVRAQGAAADHAHREAEGRGRHAWRTFVRTAAALGATPRAPALSAPSLHEEGRAAARRVPGAGAEGRAHRASSSGTPPGSTTTCGPTLREHGAALCVAEGEKLESPLVATADWGYVRLRRDEYSGRGHRGVGGEDPRAAVERGVRVPETRRGRRPERGQAAHRAAGAELTGAGLRDCTGCPGRRRARGPGRPEVASQRAVRAAIDEVSPAVEGCVAELEHGAAAAPLALGALAAALGLGGRGDRPGGDLPARRGERAGRGRRRGRGRALGRGAPAAGIRTRRDPGLRKRRDDGRYRRRRARLGRRRQPDGRRRWHERRRAPRRSSRRGFRAERPRTRREGPGD